MERVEAIACEACDVLMRQLGESKSDRRAEELGVTRVPSVAVDGETLAYCQSEGFDAERLREAGVGSSQT